MELFFDWDVVQLIEELSNGWCIIFSSGTSVSCKQFEFNKDDWVDVYEVGRYTLSLWCYSTSYFTLPILKSLKNDKIFDPLKSNCCISILLKRKRKHCWSAKANE